ncbi:hypothetical protein ABB37_08940 [Leptomonas pyrrhocoris]|uniref:Uncharacterized protein n=1 Tax=Leptomonas pyrrhocoris TaxID=157538 RepID=A0A0N1J4D3_LEPPY|nr:hypothetical protein ABB37_08940 [Leptomonas pyrrhocoris]KPA74978.1 hypothetical protein ABB37_08940 [Leptomonas pyrrhocoris]|eukprot:XP_015653417.1 hypothetical protein ABB37_08940 [Leptomonas pyrrhocoris]
MQKDFKPLILESTGGLHKDSFNWLRKLAGAKEHPYTPNTALSTLLTRISQALYEGNAYMFHVADSNFKQQQTRQLAGRVIA